jgi:hypothetical protein
MASVSSSSLPSLGRFFKDSGLTIALTLTLLVISAVLAILPEREALFVGVVLVGLPLAGLVISRRTRNTAVVVMLAMLPLTAILKAFTGIRFAPLVFDLGLLLACVLHLGEGVLRGKLRMGPLDFLLVFLWGLAFVQMFNPNVPSLQAGIEGFRKFIFMSIAFYIARHLFTLRDFGQFAKGIVLVSIPVTLYGIKQFFVMWPIDYRMIDLSTSSEITFMMGGWIRPFSTMSGTFQLGLYLMVMLLLLLVLLRDARSGPWGRAGLLVLAALQLGLLLMTRTKGNWGGFLIGAILLVILQSRNPFRATVRLSLLGALGGVVLFFVLGFASGNMATVLNEAIVAITNPMEAPTFVYRMDLWGETVFPALREGWLTGFGTSSAGEGLNNLYEGTRALFFYSHNLYLKVLLELGILGLTAFLALIASSVLIGLRWLVRAKPQHRYATMLVHWSIVTVAAFLVSGIVIPNLDAYPANYYFWLLLGALSRPRTLQLTS